MKVPPANSAAHAWAETSAPVGLPEEVLKFSDLLRRCLGKQEFAVSLLHKFRKRIPEQLLDLERHCAANDRRQAALLAHELKGAAATVGAQSLSAAFALVETQARQEQGPPLAPCMVQAHRQWDLVAEWLDRGEWPNSHH